MTTIQLRDLRKSFGAFEAIKGIDMEIRSGEFMVFVGPSGCGKSTLLRLICGLEDISAGTLTFDGAAVNRLPPARRGVAMVFQSYALYPHMTVFENMAFGMKLAGADKGERRRRVERAADMLQLTPYLERLPKQLSGGQRQRVAIGRAIVRDPKVFLFDEPLSNLDAALRVATRLEIARLHRSIAKTTMVYVTHDQVEAMTLADRICVLRDGRVEQIGTPLELYQNPVNTFVAGFIGSPKMNVLTGPLAAAAGAATIGIRPEHLAIATTAPGAGPDARSAPETPEGWHGEIIHSEMLGSDSYLYVDIGGAEPLVVREEGVTRRQPGERIALTAAAAHLHRFDGEGRVLTRSPMPSAA